MVWPIAIAAAATVGSALLQWYNSSQAAQASAEERAKVEELLSQINEPGFDLNKITPEQFSVVAKYTPETVPTIAEAAPTVVKAASEGAQTGRAAQRKSLERMLQQAESGTDPIYEAAQRKAARSAAGTAASSRASLSDQFARRGAMNSGLQFAGNQAAIGSAETAQAIAGEDAAANQFARQQAAQQNAANLGGQMFGQDVGIEQTNANILNSFNQRAVQNAMEANQFNAQQKWNAQLQNQNLAQDVANRNVTQGNAAQYENRDYGNKMQQQAYQNKLDKLRIQQGIGSQNAQDAYGNAAQQNQAISGLAGGIANVAGYYGQQQENAANRDLEREKIKAGYKG